MARSRPCYWLALVLSLPLGPLSAQYPTDGKPARSLLYGRRETASVDLTRLGVVEMDDLLPWRHQNPPLAEGTGTSARLWTDLPITIGTLQVPPGTYSLRLMAPRTLVLTREGEGAEGELGRVELSQGSSGMQVFNWSLAVVTTRRGDDTLSMSQVHLPNRDIVRIRHGPGTTSVLRLRYLDQELSAPISAR